MSSRRLDIPSGLTDWYGPYVAPALYSMDDGRVLAARCTQCDHWWREPGNPAVAHIPAPGDETLLAFAVRHDEAAHGKAGA